MGKRGGPDEKSGSQNDFPVQLPLSPPFVLTFRYTERYYRTGLAR